MELLRSQHMVNVTSNKRPYLLISNGEFALGLLVLLGECRKFLNRLRLGNSETELDIALCVLVARLCPSDSAARFNMRSGTYINLSVIRQRRKRLVQRLVHLGSRTLEEATTA